MRIKHARIDTEVMNDDNTGVNSQNKNLYKYRKNVRT